MLCAFGYFCSPHPLAVSHRFHYSSSIISVFFGGGMCIISRRHHLNNCVHRHCAQPHLSTRPFYSNQAFTCRPHTAPVSPRRSLSVMLCLRFCQIQTPPVTLASSKVTKVACAQTPHWYFFCVFVLTEKKQNNNIFHSIFHLQLKTTSV